VSTPVSGYESCSESAYTGCAIALLTRHGKERVIGPPLEAMLGALLQLDDGYDTDSLGTFTRDVPRTLGQRETALRKAVIAIERSGLPLGLGSEGVFGPDPFTGLLPWNLEMLVLVDRDRDITVVGTAQGPASFAHLKSANWEAVADFARDRGFPAQHLVLRPEGQDDPRIRKGIDSWSALAAAFDEAQRQARDGQVFIETDGRAFANPERMTRIGEAARDLAARLCSRCPACQTPGFAAVERVRGLPCAACGAPTREVLEEIHGCLKCDCRIARPSSPRRHADPGNCDQCNP
jgi:hypothetical protein